MRWRTLVRTNHHDVCQPAGKDGRITYLKKNLLALVSVELVSLGSK